MVMDSLRTINDISAMIDTGRRFLDKSSPFDEAPRAEISPISGAAEQRRLDAVCRSSSQQEARGFKVRAVLVLLTLDEHNDAIAGDNSLRAKLAHGDAKAAIRPVNLLPPHQLQLIRSDPELHRKSGQNTLNRLRDGRR